MTLCGVCNKDVGTFNSYVPTLKCKICSMRPNTSKLHSSLKAGYIVIFLMIQHCTNYQFQMQCSKISLTQQAPCLLFKKKRRLRWLLLWVQFCKLFRLCKLLLPQTVFYTFLYWFKVAMTMLTIIRFIILHCEVVLYMTLFTCFLLIKVHFILLPFFFFTN